MAQRNTLAHFLHDAGLAVWFGGSLMGAVGVNGAGARVHRDLDRAFDPRHDAGVVPFPVEIRWRLIANYAAFSFTSMRAGVSFSS